MAFKTKFLYPMFMLALFLVVVVGVQESSGCYTGHSCYYPKPTSSSLEIRSRKVLLVAKGTTTINGGELRTAPSGPDPLHHNGATPKKPTTP